MSVHSGSITQRRVNCDLTVMSIDGEDILAYFRDATLEITGEPTDVTAAMDTWKQRELCVKDWRVTCNLLAYVSERFGSSIISGGTCIVSTDLAGKTFYGVGLLTGWTYNSGDPHIEGITIESAGSTPTLS